MREVLLWRGGREQASLDTRMLLDCRGEPIARVHQAPSLLVHRAADDLRRAAAGPGHDFEQLWSAIARAGELLEKGDPGGVSAAENAGLVSQATGTPLFWNRQALAELAAGLRGIREALGWQAPGGDLTAFASHRVALPGERCHAWVPAGRVLGFVAPSNHPAVHLTWVMALAMGWTVLLRPGADDPLTPWRLALALRESGFPADRLAVLPGGHDLVPTLVEACDRTLAYGGAALAAQFGRDARVRWHGPGRSKVLVDALPVHGLADTGAVADFLLDCILHGGGRQCTAASAILVRGRVPGLLTDLAERLEALPLLDPLDPAARVPACKEAAAAGQSPARVAVRDGLTFIKPALVHCATPHEPLFGLELPAPWATAAELAESADPLPALRGSLAVTLLSWDPALRDACLLEPAIQKVFVGPVPPWHTEPGAPHQGRLSEFLFTSKAWREVAWTWT